MLRTPSHDKTRPTAARLRQALLNSLQTIVPSARVLDLFAGSGALGFEALSRGAASVVFLESAPPVAKLIRQNAEMLQVLPKCRILTDPFQKSIDRLHALAPFDLVFADPPYSKGFEKRVLEDLDWAQCLAPEGWLVIESSSRDEPLPDRLTSLVKTKEKVQGDSRLVYYQKT